MNEVDPPLAVEWPDGPCSTPMFRRHTANHRFPSLETSPHSSPHSSSSVLFWGSGSRRFPMLPRRAIVESRCPAARSTTNGLLSVDDRLSSVE